jgi:glycosyltransferase involved in cell wall biosynthesis
MDFINKTILIISPERWGMNRVSKHNYAIALAKNNKVYFLNPPSRVDGIKATSSGYENLTVLDYASTFKGLNRLLFILPLFNLLNRYEINRLQKFCGPFDIVWSFDPFRFQNLSLFRAGLSIFHCVDFIDTQLDLFCAKTADLVLSVAQPILDKYQSLHRPTHFINHGVSPVYLNTKKNSNPAGGRIKCGYVGNLLSFGIDHEILIEITRQNPEVEFYFIGPYSESNLGKFELRDKFITLLKSFDHVKLLGQLPPEKVADTIQSFDLFLISYHAEKMGPVASNNHKLLEYLSTGKVVVSSRMSTYDQLAPPLFEMVRQRDELPIRFQEVVKNLDDFNRAELQEKRIQYADANSYENHLREIELLAERF